MSKKEHETPVDPEAKTTPKEKKSASKRKWYWIIIIILVLVLIAVVAFGIVRMNGRKSSSKNSAGNAKATTTVTTTHVDITDPGSPLTYSDFSFGGRTVKGYKNFIDLCEKEGGSHNYYFDSTSEACKKANRGINVDDLFAYMDDGFAAYENIGEPTPPDAKRNKIFDQFGKTDEKDWGCDYPPFERYPNENDPDNFKKYDYTFQKGKYTYHKIFYFVIGHHYGEYMLIGIEYINQ